MKSQQRSRITKIQVLKLQIKKHLASLDKDSPPETLPYTRAVNFLWLNSFIDENTRIYHLSNFKRYRWKGR
jgi:hypothetical protein